MKTTIELDELLVATASEFSGIKETSALIGFAPKDYIQREAARRLARLGGSEPVLQDTRVAVRRCEYRGPTRNYVSANQGRQCSRRRCIASCSSISV